MMKRFLATLLFLMSASALANPASSIVLLYVPAPQPGNIMGGTGFEVVAPNGLVYTITNAHVCSLSSNGFMSAHSEARGEDYAQLAILKVEEETDLCALAPIPKPRALRLGQPPRPLQNVVILGHPLLQPLTMSQGYVTSMEAGEFLSTAKVFPGNSGSPVLDGKIPVVVGVVHMYDTTDRTSININVEALRRFLKSLQ